MIEILKNKYVQLGLALFVGITIGAVFYPTSKIEEKYKSQYELKETELKQTHSAETQALTESLQKEEASHKSYQEETTKKISTLVTENSSLKSSIKKRKYKLIKPDGTIVEEEFEDSNTESSTSKITEIREEFNKKVSEIEDKWKKVHEERIAVIQKQFDEKLEKAKQESKTVEQSRTVETNQKKLGIEAGMTTERDYYAHGTYTLWGPVFIGVGADMNHTDKTMNNARFGLGVSL